MKRTADLSCLLHETPEAYYWVGFLLADGYLTDKLVKLQLAEADRDHLQRYAKFVNYTGKAKTCCVNVRHPDMATALKKKFRIPNRKTYNPCRLPPIEDKLLFSLFMGMIDGDGSMRSRRGFVYTIEVKMHKSWMGVLQKMEDFLYAFSHKKKSRSFTRLNKKGYALLILSNSGLIGCLKNKINELNLPILDRKWRDVNELCTLSLPERMSLKAEDYRARLARGQSVRQIAEETNQKHDAVYMFIRRRQL